MDLSDLQLFCDLVETRSFTRTAERRFVSQSAVSQRLRALEREVGQTLLERSRGRSGVVPTEAGAALYEGARSLLRQAGELETRVRGLGDVVAGTVRVATVYSVGLHALPGRLKAFLAAHPGVNVHLEYSQTRRIYQDVLSGAVDVGIVACPVPRTGIEIVPFGEDEMVLVTAPERPLARLDSIPLSRLAGEPLIAFADEIPTRRLTDERLRAAGVHPRIVAAFDNIETIKNMVEIGFGCALLPESTVQREVREGTLVQLRLAPGQSFRRPAGILLGRSGHRRGAVRAFVEATRAAA